MNLWQKSWAKIATWGLVVTFATTSTAACGPAPGVSENPGNTPQDPQNPVALVEDRPTAQATATATAEPTATALPTATAAPTSAPTDAPEAPIATPAPAVPVDIDAAIRGRAAELMWRMALPAINTDRYDYGDELDPQGDGKVRVFNQQLREASPGHYVEDKAAVTTFLTEEEVAEARKQYQGAFSQDCSSWIAEIMNRTLQALPDEFFPDGLRPDIKGDTDAFFAMEHSLDRLEEVRAYHGVAKYYTYLADKADFEAGIIEKEPVPVDPPASLDLDKVSPERLEDAMAYKADLDAYIQVLSDFASGKTTEFPDGPPQPREIDLTEQAVGTVFFYNEDLGRGSRHVAMLIGWVEEDNFYDHYATAPENITRYDSYEEAAAANPGKVIQPMIVDNTSQEFLGPDEVSDFINAGKYSPDADGNPYVAGPHARLLPSSAYAGDPYAYMADTSGLGEALIERYLRDLTPEEKPVVLAMLEEAIRNHPLPGTPEAAIPGAPEASAPISAEAVAAVIPQPQFDLSERAAYDGPIGFTRQEVRTALRGDADLTIQQKRYEQAEWELEHRRA